MRRRALIRRALLILGASPVALIGCASRKVATGSSSQVPAGLRPASTAGGLSAAEIEDLVALGEVLVEGRGLPPTERQYLVEHIEGRAAEGSPFLALYRAAAITLERLAGRRFATLELQERLDFVRRRRLMVPAADRGEGGGPTAEELRVLRTRTIPDLIRGYYGSPAGWAVVGYESFPGRCGDVTRYRRPEV